MINYVNKKTQGDIELSRGSVKSAETLMQIQNTARSILSRGIVNPGEIVTGKALADMGIKPEDFVRYINERKYAEKQLSEQKKNEAFKTRTTTRLN